MLPLEAEVVDAEFTNEELTYRWQLFLHHNTHYHPEAPIDFPKGGALITPIGCGEELYWYRIEHTVTDPAGLSTTATHLLFPDCDSLAFWCENLFGTPQGTGILLTWNPENSGDITEYLILKGNQPEGMILLDRLPANGDIEHQYFDPEPLEPMNSYQIIGVSARRQMRPSNIFSTAFPITGTLSAYPNPFSNALYLKMRQQSLGNYHLKLFSADGKLVLENDYQHNESVPWKTKLDVPDLPEGIYFYQLIHGGETHSGQVQKRIR